MQVTVILGTGREGRRSELVANFVVNYLRKLGLEVVLVDVRDYPLGFTRRGDGNVLVENFRKVITSSNALVIVSPEYNRSYPGELKLLLDTLRDEYESLPVGLVTVSAGQGGCSVLSELRLLCLNLGMLPVAYFMVFNVNRFNSVDDLSKFHLEEMKELAERILFYAKSGRGS